MKNSFNLKLKGFTIVEMIVVVAIFALVSVVVFANYTTISTSATVTSTSQDIALSIRKAQQYALGFRSPQIQNQTDSLGGFGVRFGGNLTSTDSKQFILFADFNETASMGSNDHVYTGTSCGTLTKGNECLEQLSITTSDKISSVCMSTNGTSSSSSNNCLSSTQVLNISFTRPYPDAYFCYQTNGGSCTTTLSNNPISDVTITINASDGTKRKVTIWNTGQISVK